MAIIVVWYNHIFFRGSRGFPFCLSVIIWPAYKQRNTVHKESIVEPRKILKTSPDKKVGGIIRFFTDRVNLKLRKLSLSQQCLRSSSLSLSGGGGGNWEARMRPTTDKPPRKNWEWADDPSSELRLDKITLRKTLHWLPASAQLLPLCLAQLAVCLLLSRYKHIPLHALLVLNFHSRREIKMFHL